MVAPGRFYWALSVRMELDETVVPAFVLRHLHLPVLLLGPGKGGWWCCGASLWCQSFTIPQAWQGWLAMLRFANVPVLLL